MSDAIRRYCQIVTEGLTRGYLAVAYHRTRSIASLEAIQRDGYRVGDGNTYGAGIYATYEFASQQVPAMAQTYGPYVVKNRINLDGFLIFERDVAQGLYGDAWSLADQCRRLGVSLDGIAEADRELGRQKYSSVVAYRLYTGNPTLPRRVAGLLYRGERDGHCVVAYEPTRVVPFSYAESRLGDLGETDPDAFAWTPIDARPHLARQYAPLPYRDRLEGFFRVAQVTRKALPMFRQLLRRLDSLDPEDARRYLKWFANLYGTNVAFRFALTDADHADINRLKADPRYAIPELSVFAPSDDDQFLPTRWSGPDDWD